MSGRVLHREVAVLPAGNEFEYAAAEVIAAAVTSAIDDRGACLMALSGGRTPQGAYRRTADFLAARRVDLRRLHLVFVDERMVPPGDADSNYGMIRDAFISRVSIPADNVHRIRGEAEAGVAERAYEAELDDLFAKFDGRCDLIVLGVGEDGHTASLFPGTDALDEHEHKVRTVSVPSLDSRRVTLTLPVINRAREILFLVTGRRKTDIVEKIFTGDPSTVDLPATRVHPDSGTLTWMLDTDAASGLPDGSTDQERPAVN